MKTGFTCPAGFNVVASANNHGRRLIVVVLGAPTARSRNQEAADLFDRGFAMSGGSGSLESLPPAQAPRPICAPTSACIATRPRSPPSRTRVSAIGAGGGGIGRRGHAPVAFRGAVLAGRAAAHPAFGRTGSISIPCRSMSVRRPAGRVRRWALARPQRDGRRPAPRPFRVDVARAGHARATQARPSALPNSTRSVRSIRRRGMSRNGSPSQSRADGKIGQRRQ